jgi:hypothetical protein
LVLCVLVVSTGRSAATTFNGDPIVLTGNQTLTITDPDYVIKNDITLHDNSTLIIRDSTFTHSSDYFDQFTLRAYDNAKVIIERSTLRGTANWKFSGNSSLRMTDVPDYTLWSVFSDQSTAIVRNANFRVTVLDASSVDIDGARQADIETGFPPASTVDESLPLSVGSTPYVFPNDGERGIRYQLKLANVAATNWGVTIEPDSDITFRDTRVAIGMQLPSTYSGLTVQLDNLRSKLYVDDSWSFAHGVIRLKNTYAGAWYPGASGNNRLIITNSTLADMDIHNGRAQVSISDSTLSVPVAREFVRIDITRSAVNGNVTAIDNGIITITDSVVAGKLVKQGNGLIIATGLIGLGKGWQGLLTVDPSEVISGRASIKAVNFGTSGYFPVLTSDPNVIRLSANQTYRLTFKYRIVTAPSKGFDVEFLSGKGIAAGNFLPSLTINGKDGDTGTATLTTKLGPYDDYWVKVGIIATGALVIDDIQLVDTATGQVIASEGGEDPITVDQ